MSSLSIFRLSKKISRPITTLEEYDVTLIQRVSAAETLLGLKTVYQVGGVPFVRLNTQGLQEHQRRLSASPTLH